MIFNSKRFRHSQYRFRVAYTLCLNKHKESLLCKPLCLQRQPRVRFPWQLKNLGGFVLIRCFPLLDFPPQRNRWARRKKLPGSYKMDAVLYSPLKKRKWIDWIFIKVNKLILQLGGGVFILGLKKFQGTDKFVPFSEF